MALTFTRQDSGFITTQADDQEARVLGEFLATDVAHMPTVIRELLTSDADQQVIMDATRMKMSGDIIEIEHLYLDLPPFKASKDTILGYIFRWESYLTAQEPSLTIALVD